MASAASKSKSAAVLVLLVSLAGVATTVDARFRAMQWTPAHATFYGDEATAETMGGACGYDITAGYGADTAALSSTLFKKMADWHAGIVPVMYRRVPCMRKGGIRFAFQGNPHWLLVYVTNVGGAGDVGEMWVKGSGGMVWLRMSHNWGASYQAFGQLGGQALSFKLTSYTTGLTIVAADAAPASWSIGLTYQARANFK
ncbi:putative expansin-A30 [Triticum dicoccoides]|uniref:putative expansin-A30 n=1 Tax=Triticum dicoccoides TaxID=85692 RepID=UPI00188FEF0D|nr:putative expansin-A30 [Triticum dicoccoides]